MINTKQTYAVFSPQTKTRTAEVLSNIQFLVTFAFMVYISQGSTWWTFVAGSLFLLLLFAKVSALLKADTNKFTTKAELQKWVDGLDDTP